MLNLCRETILKSVTPMLVGLKSLLSLWSANEIIFRLREVMVVRAV